MTIVEVRRMLALVAIGVAIALAFKRFPGAPSALTVMAGPAIVASAMRPRRRAVAR